MRPYGLSPVLTEPPRFEWRSARTATSLDGSVCDGGRIANGLRSSLAAVAHLISLLAIQPRAAALQAGELVTTGTLTQALPIRAGETWSPALDGIGQPGLSLIFVA